MRYAMGFKLECDFMTVPINDEMIMPKSASLSFLYNDEPISTVPVFLLIKLAKANDPKGEDESRLDQLFCVPEDIDSTRSNEYFDLFARNIKWEELEPYILCLSYLKTVFKTLWIENSFKTGHFSFSIKVTALPSQIFRYMQFKAERMQILLSSGKLFMPSPSLFNVPFDCSLDESIRLTFIESAIGCFSTRADNVLMFSHYTHNHEGICVGFDTRRLILSLIEKNQPWSACIRPVWYLPQMPDLTLKDESALCATCKHDIWSYEQEFRLFLYKNSSLRPSGSFDFDRTAITNIIYGCKATDETVATCKTLTHDLPSIKLKCTPLARQNIPELR